MKLRNLFEDKELQQAGRNHLVMGVTERDIDGRHYPVYTAFVISDVPRLDEHKFQKLYNLSFEDKSLSDYIDVFPHNTYHKDQFGPGKETPQNWTDEEHDDWLQYLPDGPYPRINQPRSKVMKWKECVTMIKSDYPHYYNDDDFTE